MPATIEATFIPSSDLGELLFRRMSGTEALGRLPEYRVELLRDSEIAPIKPDALLGTKAGVKILSGKDKYRHVHGIVTRFERGGVVGSYDIYRIELRPWLWQLTLGADCKIFQDKTAIEVIEAVFADYSTAGAVSKKLNASYRKRPYTVQYRESDFNFVSRLMEEEGLYYYFTHVQGQHTLVLCDNPSGHVPLEGGALHWGANQVDKNYRDDVVQRWQFSHNLGSLKYVHTDFAPDKPTVDLKSQASRTLPYGKPNELEVFDYPGGYEDLAMVDAATGSKTTEGTRLAQRRVDSYESAHAVVLGLTTYRFAAAGYTFEFKDHGEHGDNGQYLITATEFEMEYGGYESEEDNARTGFSCRFEAVPKTVHFQPRAGAAAALIHGPQTATVVGASGDEITTDKYGRVKLQFHWDRLGTKNEKSSCWVRVSQPWAGKGFGFIALPRIGDEVVVEFLEGNPDRPLITGRVYNGVNMPPYELPAQATVSGLRTRSSKGGGATNFNELRFDDKKGSEYVWLQAEKDFHRLVKHDVSDTVQNDVTTTIGNNQTHSVGKDAAVTIAGNTAVSVGKDTHLTLAADFNIDTAGMLNLQVGDNVAIYGAEAVAFAAGGAFDLNIGQAAKISAGSSLHIKGLGIVIDGGTQLTIKAGSGFITLDSGGVTIQGAEVKINSGGAAGAAGSAKKASPAKPKAPDAAKKDTDPIGG